MSRDNAKREFRDEQIRKLREKREMCFAILFEMTFSDDTIEQILENAKQSKVLDKMYADNKKLEEELAKRKSSRKKQNEAEVIIEVQDEDDEIEEEVFSPDTDEFIMNILNSFTQHKDEIDDIIKSHIKGWTIERLSRVTLSVLRFAVTELKYGSTSEKIVINEAVELSKKYSTSQDARFVNGVLGSVVRKNEE